MTKWHSEMVENAKRTKKSASNGAATPDEAGSVPEQGTKPAPSVAPQTQGVKHNAASAAASVKLKTKRKQVLRSLRFDLTGEELVARAGQAGAKSRALLELENEFDSVKAQYKGRLEKLEGEIAGALRVVEDRAEWREVLCDEVHDYDAAMVRFEYEGKTYEQREMSAREKQLVLEIVESEKVTIEKTEVANG